MRLIRRRLSAVARPVLFAAVLWSVTAVSHAATGARCEALLNVHTPTLTVTDSEFISDTEIASRHYAGLPFVCRVRATLRPSADSDIHMELWLPEPRAWNDKYEGTGNGGWGGAIDQNAIATAVRRGYAASSSDTGPLPQVATTPTSAPLK